MFGFHKSDVGHNFPTSISQPTKASTSYKVGDALVLSGGELTKATGTTVPTYICAETYNAPETDNKPIAVYPVVSGQQWITTLAEDGADLNVGDKVTIHADSAQATATTESGVFEIIEIKGSAVGGFVVGKF